MMQHRRRNVLLALSALLVMLALLLPSARALAQDGKDPGSRINHPFFTPYVSHPWNLLANPGNHILDPGFEANYPNPYWMDYSATFTFVECTINSCGTGMGTGPHSGSVWVWFGGSSSGDTGYISQTVKIHVGTPALLTFWVEQAVCGTAGTANYLRLMLDETEIWRTDGTDPACNQIGYRQVSLDISSYADGTNHLLKFDSVTVGSGNFFLDDVSLKIPSVSYLPLVHQK